VIVEVVLVAQGENDIGFLEGLRERLRCGANAIHYLSGHPELRQRSHHTRTCDAKDICERFRNADLIVRLTDGDANRPQDACREELERWPSHARPKLVCGVCDRDVEHWICLDPDYAARRLHFAPDQLPKERKDRSGFIKHRIDEARGSQARKDFVAGFVRDAQVATMRRWLANPAFGTFYSECVRAAKLQDCEVNDERK
jgi:hypothetical protein